MPSFVARVERPDRGGAWAGYLAERRAAGERWAARLGLARRRPRRRPAVGRAHPRRRRRGAAAHRAAVRGGRARRGADPRRGRPAGRDAERGALLADLAGDRANRRHRPGRGFEALRYRFEIVSDYGAFRDLQRHRMLTVQWQGLTPDLGAGVPEEVVAAGEGDAYAAALERSAAEYHRLAGAGLAAAAPVRALPRLPDPLRARPERARGDAPRRAALGRRGAPGLPRRRAPHARADRPAPPRGRCGDDARRHARRAAARAHPLRDAPAVAPRRARGLSPLPQPPDPLGALGAPRRVAGGDPGRPVR